MSRVSPVRKKSDNKSFAELQTIKASCPTCVAPPSHALRRFNPRMLENVRQCECPLAPASEKHAAIRWLLLCSISHAAVPSSETHCGCFSKTSTPNITTLNP